MPAPRSCLRCDCLLARDNSGPYCSPCEREEWVPTETVPDDGLVKCAIQECQTTFKDRSRGPKYCSRAHKQLAFARRSWAKQAGNTAPPTLAPINHRGKGPDAVLASLLRDVLLRSLPALYASGCNKVPCPQHRHERGIRRLAQFHQERFGGNWDSTARRLHRIMAGQRWVNRFFADEICTILAEDVYLEEEA